MRQEADGPSSPARVKQLEVHPLLTKTPQDESSLTINGGGWALP